MVTALGRELLGFVWAVALEAEKQQQARRRSLFMRFRPANIRVINRRASSSLSSALLSLTRNEAAPPSRPPPRLCFAPLGFGGSIVAEQEDC
jgi:hypothetical protein